MNSIILAYPYAGVLYRYFTSEIAGSNLESLIANPYYKTLYGSRYEQYINLALSFLFLYDEIWIAPADNHIPKSKESPDNQGFIKELGLYADWDDFRPENYQEHHEHIELLSNHNDIKFLLGNTFGIPKKNWSQIITDAIYEANLSRRERIPVLCSTSRRKLISAIVQIQNPALHPLFSPSSEIKFVDTYTSLVGLALAPKSLDQLMDVKQDINVRTYGKSLIKASQKNEPDAVIDKKSVAIATLEAINTESVSNLYAGKLNWAATFLRLIKEPVFASGASAASYLASAGANDAGWYEFKGSIDRAIDKKEFVRTLEIEAGSTDT